jgi:outer membrane protein assembly factor BamB
MDDSFVDKYDQSGTLLWTTGFEGPVFDVAVDEDGNVLFSGNDIGMTATHWKYSPLGALLWVRNHGQTVYSIADTYRHAAAEAETS